MQRRQFTFLFFHIFVTVIAKMTTKIFAFLNSKVTFDDLHWRCRSLHAVYTVGQLKNLTTPSYHKQNARCSDY